MGALLLYIIKSGICLTLFYILFKLLLSRTTFFGFNRFTLLLGMLLCTVLPFIEVKVQDNQQWLYTPFYSLQEILLAENNIQVAPQSSIALPFKAEVAKVSVSTPFSFSFNYLLHTVTIIYITGCILTLGYLLVSIGRMLHFIRKSEKIKYKNYTLIVVNEPVCSFNWAKYIIISATDYQKHSREILMHETMHLKYGHTADLLVMQFLLIVHWFNPAVWLLRRELQEVHEFQADSAVINTGIDATQYQLLLVKKAVGTRLYSMANGFNHSKLKNRITMMLKEKTSKTARFRVLLFVPAVTGVLFAFAQPEVQKTVAPLLSSALQVESPKQSVYTKDGIIKEYNQELEAFKQKTIQKQVSDKTIISEMNSTNLLVNARNQILFNNERVEVEGLKDNIVKTIVAKHQKLVATNNDKVQKQIIHVMWDRSTDDDALEKILIQLKYATDEIKRKLAQPTGNHEEQYPVLVVINTNIKDIVGNSKHTYNQLSVTCQTKDKVMKTLENFTNEEPEKELNRLAVTSDELIVSVKVKNSIKNETEVNLLRVFLTAS